MPRRFLRALAPRVASLRSQAVYLAYATGWAIVRRMPERLAYVLFRAGADLAVRRDGKGVRQLRANLRRVRPEADEVELSMLARDGMRSYLRYWCESFRLPVTPPSTVLARTVLHGEEHLVAGATSGRGVVVGLPHMGNWDQAGAWAVARGIPFTTVAERLEPERLFDRFLAYREGLGMEVIPLTGGENPFPVLVSRLRAGGAVFLVADRDLTAAGIPVTLFGEPTRMPAGPAALARATGADLLAATTWYDGDELHVEISAPIPVGVSPGREGRAEAVAVATQVMADVFAASIAAHPADWHMLARLWLADLDPERAPRAAA